MSSLSLILRRAAAIRRGGGRTVAMGLAVRHSTSGGAVSSNFFPPSGGCGGGVWSSSMMPAVSAAIQWHPSTQKRFHSTAAPDEGEQGEQICGTFGTSERFEDLTNLHPASMRAVTDVLGLSTMTEIQSKTFDAASSGRDVLGRARTGTGKTLAFLLPALESVLRHDDRPGDNIGVLVLSPTRELALQIHTQAEALLSTHDRKLTSQVMFGGSSRREDVRRLQRRLPTVLVATPGRLQDHLSSTDLRGVPFADLVRKTRVLVLDETDRLLDMGFRADIERILSYLPSDRQTLLFSATLPPAVRGVMAETMRPDFVTVDCVHDHDPASHTNAQVDQSHVVLPPGTDVDGPVRIITQIMDENPDHKLIAFFPTAQLVSYYSQLFNFALNRRVIEIHSRKSQSYRTSASNRFREKRRRVAMFTSDVSARGVDYPGVTDVVQVGVPDSRETYIHRLGRTGRAGSRGKGLLVLSEPERAFLKTLEGLDVPVNDDHADLLSTLKLDDQSSTTVDAVAERMERMRSALRAGQNSSLEGAAEGAYRSMLGYYNAQSKQLKFRSKSTLVSMVNDFAAAAGLEEPPMISPKIAKSVGLDRVRGINIGHAPARGDGGGGGRGGGRDFSRGYEGRGNSRNGDRQRRGGGGDRGGGRRQQQRGEYGGGSLSGRGSYEEWGGGFSGWDSAPSERHGGGGRNDSRGRGGSRGRGRRGSR